MDSDVDCAIVGGKHMHAEMIIGMNLLGDADLSITANGINIMRRGVDVKLGAAM